MASPLDLSLTHGQVAWALARGQQPSALLLDQLRYLRQLGVPLSEQELGGGSGNRIHYGFDHLIELGVALFGLQRGMAPREVAGILVDHRAELRRCYRDTLAALPASAFEEDWVKSRGAAVPIMNEIPEPAGVGNREVSGRQGQNIAPALAPCDRTRRLGTRGT